MIIEKNKNLKMLKNNNNIYIFINKKMDLMYLQIRCKLNIYYKII